ncbi:TPA: hypothetical protein OTX73_004880 [Escherichia coli]|nr:hypothetical protein [Escherichia coli]HCQ9474833.1 hypothetical protein [Escherichia coli]HCT4273694.1 hypothetical protein [Escherichia coli]HCT8343016.1 hypothetical protein [Escherichia coli]HDD9433868.1 hypothetical protein [Escherichia coli]
MRKSAIGAMYNFFALYSFREKAMLYGFIATFPGWILYGLVSPRFELKNRFKVASSL